jgi:hypothetical protein
MASCPAANTFSRVARSGALMTMLQMMISKYDASPAALESVAIFDATCQTVNHAPLGPASDNARQLGECSDFRRGVRKYKRDKASQWPILHREYTRVSFLQCNERRACIERPRLDNFDEQLYRLSSVIIHRFALKLRPAAEREVKA